MTIEEMEKAYNLLSLMHSETMLDNVRLREEIRRLENDWWRALTRRVRRVFWRG